MFTTCANASLYIWAFCLLIGAVDAVDSMVFIRMRKNCKLRNLLFLQNFHFHFSFSLPHRFFHHQPYFAFPISITEFSFSFDFQEKVRERHHHHHLYIYSYVQRSCFDTLTLFWFNTLCTHLIFIYLPVGKDNYDVKNQMMKKIMMMMMLLLIK